MVAANFSKIPPSYPTSYNRGMDENPYKAPDEDEPNAPERLPAKHSDFLDPTRNEIELLVVVAVIALAYVLKLQ